MLSYLKYGPINSYIRRDKENKIHVDWGALAGLDIGAKPESYVSYLQNILFNSLLELKILVLKKRLIRLPLLKMRHITLLKRKILINLKA